MGIIIGYICLVLFLLLALKFVAKRLGWKKVNGALMKGHKFVALAFLIGSVLHFILVIPVLEGRHSWVNMSGIVILVLGIALTIVCHRVKNRKVEIRFHRAFTLSMLIMTVVHMAVYFVDFGQYRTAVDSIQIEEVNLDEIEDGAYEGEYDAGYIYAKVRVTVKNHQITEVELLKHREERGERAEVVTGVIEKEQKLQVDTVSGATNSSKVIMKACENALSQKQVIYGKKN
ncbi:MAG: FMN-binding protein [Lachnospiraceae bacterium]|nr:FMN-binding protein [Lachnospiraceae bacterium]